MTDKKTKPNYYKIKLLFLFVVDCFLQLMFS
jgi:hypothetical protein